VHLDEAGKADKAWRGVERVEKPQLQDQAQWKDHPKRINVEAPHNHSKWWEQT